MFMIDAGGCRCFPHLSTGLQSFNELVLPISLPFRSTVLPCKYTADRLKYSGAVFLTGCQEGLTKSGVSRCLGISVPAIMQKRFCIASVSSLTECVNADKGGASVVDSGVLRCRSLHSIVHLIPLKLAVVNRH